MPTDFLHFLVSSETQFMQEEEFQLQPSEEFYISFFSYTNSHIKKFCASVYRRLNCPVQDATQSFASLHIKILSKPQLNHNSTQPEHSLKLG